ncbi:MAG: hypothetical protein LBC50_02635 [Candidatus Ancillula sp.]|jgi:copper homeostasis protein|nr:hypothetical protein [Candidatus Ancillula sp.]
MVVKEFCADELRDLEKAVETDITRIELCSDLSIGGVQVSEDVLKRALETCHAKGKKVYAMVRNRGGNFFYNDVDLVSMEEFAVMATDLGADGLVFGPLKEVSSENDSTHTQIAVELEAILRMKTQLLVKCGRIPELVFHMAFDLIGDQERAVEELIEQGYIRILTHGTTDGAIDTNHIKEVVDLASGRIEIMAGGGVNFSNLDQILTRSSADSVHGTQIVQLSH